MTSESMCATRFDVVHGDIQRKVFCLDPSSTAGCGISRIPKGSLCNYTAPGRRPAARRGPFLLPVSCRRRTHGTPAAETPPPAPDLFAFPLSLVSNINDAHSLAILQGQVTRPHTNPQLIVRREANTAFKLLVVPFFLSVQISTFPLL